MKNKLILMAVMGIGSLSAQQQWRINGNSTSTGDFLGTTNNQPLVIKTNNQTRAIFGATGSFTNTGLIKTDTLSVLGGARIKGRLHVGNNSMFLGGAPGPGFGDDVTSTNGVVNIGGETTVPLPFSQIKVGIGTQLPQFNVHVVDNRSPSNRVTQTFANFTTGQTSGDGFQIGVFGNGNANLNQQETNLPITLTSAGGFVGVSNNNLLFNPTSLLHVSEAANRADFQISNSATGNTAGDGVKLGITNTGIGELNQQENLDFRFYTNNTQRAVIQAGGRFGIGLNTPLNRLEIASATGDPYFGTPNGSSGLKFANLTSANTPLTNPSTNVLTVDANGNVILVPDGGGGSTNVTAQNGLSNISPSVVEWGGNLLHATFIDQAGHNIWWHNPGVFTFGSNVPIANDYKFGIKNTQHDVAQLILHNNISPTATNGQISLQIESTTSNTLVGAINLGILTKTSGAEDNRNIFLTDPIGAFNAALVTVVPGSVSEAVNGVAYHANISVGGAFGAFSGDDNAFRCYGVEGQADFGKDIAGVYGIARKGSVISKSYGVRGENYSEHGTSYGVFGSCNPVIVDPTAAYYAIYGEDNATGATTSYAGYFNGNVFTTGAYLPSDQMLKQNIDTIVNALALIKLLKPKTFDYKHTQFPSMKLPNGKQYGLIAQETETVIPELVTNNVHPAKKDSMGNIIYPAINFKGLEYTQLIPILIKAIQQQQSTIDSIRTVLGTTAGARVITPVTTTNTTNPPAVTLNKQNVTLSNADMLVLDQNQPNPFSESTVIKYNVPQKYGYAQLIFTTIDGRILKTIDIAKKGAGEITVYANDLSSGIYIYSLVVDGKTVDTKKMVKE